MANNELNTNAKRVLARFDEINTFYIEKVATQIAQIGELSASSINMIAVMASMTEDIAKINGKLAVAAQRSVPDLYKVYQRAIDDVYRDERFVRALEETPLTKSDKRVINQYAEAVSRQSAGRLLNLSNTTAVAHSYRKAVDKAILAVSTGLTGYDAAIRQTIRDVGYNGLQVEYASGHKMRLDSAVRMNILDGTKQIQQRCSDIISDSLNFDAREISVHANSAPDHEPVQGHVFLLSEFEKLQSEQESVDIDGRHFPPMRRAIGVWNCRHLAMGFDTRYTKRQYTPEQLEEMREKNAAGCEIDGKHYTQYEASQMMRRIETEIRQQKDVGVAAQAAGDTALRREAQRKINALSRKYGEVADASGLYERRDRMRVEGFKAVKAS